VYYRILKILVERNGIVESLRDRVLVEGAVSVASVRSCEKLPPCLTEPMPASSKMDLPLAKAKPLSNGASASVITY